MYSSVLMLEYAAAAIWDTVCDMLQSIVQCCN